MLIFLAAVRLLRKFCSFFIEKKIMHFFLAGYGILY